MKNLALFTMLFFAIHAKGQTAIANHSTGPSRKFQIGLIASPDLCYRVLKNNGGNQLIDEINQVRNNTENVKMGYTVGVNAIYHINQQFGIESGVQFSNKGFQSEVIDLSGQSPNPDNLLRFKYRLHFYSLDIPLKVNMTFGNSDLRFFTSLGLNTSVFLNVTETYINYYAARTEKSIEPTKSDFRSINFSPTVSVGLDYKINAVSNLRIEPTFRYGIQNVIDGPVSTYLYSGGLNISYCHGI